VVYFKQKKKNLINVQHMHIPVCSNSDAHVYNFIKFFVKDGSLLKYKEVFGCVFNNLNFFLNFKRGFIFQNFKDTYFLLESFFKKKNNYICLFDVIINLIKTPFVVKSITLPKKIRSKTKQRYVLKIMYKNEFKRLRNSYKQLQCSTDSLFESKFSTRLFKVLLYTTLE